MDCKISTRIELKPVSGDQLMREGTWVASPITRFELDFAQITRLLHYKLLRESGSSDCPLVFQELICFKSLRICGA